MLRSTDNSLSRGSTNTSLSRSNSLTETQARLLTLRSIIEDLREEPLTYADFLEFMKTKLCEENIEFLHRSYQFEQIPNSELIVIQKTLDDIFATFIIEGAPKEVNVSGSQRDEVKKLYQQFKASEAEGQPASAEDYKKSIVQCVREIEDITLSGRFVNDFMSAQSVNLCNVMLGKKRKIFFTSLFLSLLIPVVLIACHVTRWARVVDILPIFYLVWGGYCLIFNVCPLMAAMGKRAHNGKVEKIKDVLFLRRMHFAAFQGFFTLVVVSAGITAGIVAIPEL